jgi:hypothetical protein
VVPGLPYADAKVAVGGRLRDRGGESLVIRRRH